MNHKQAAKHVYHVAKTLTDGSIAHAFDLRRRDDGGLGISNVSEPPSDAERSLLYAHFGAPLVARGGGSVGETYVERSVKHVPGTPEHFLAAVHRLPPPYLLISRVEK